MNDEAYRIFRKLRRIEKATKGIADKKSTHTKVRRKIRELREKYDFTY